MSIKQKDYRGDNKIGSGMKVKNFETIKEVNIAANKIRS